MKKSFQVGIVGATGAVGQELIRLLALRHFPIGDLKLLASARSAGKTVEIDGRKLTVAEAKLGAFAGLDLCFSPRAARSLGPSPTTRWPLVAW